MPELGGGSGKDFGACLQTLVVSRLDNSWNEYVLVVLVHKMSPKKRPETTHTHRSSRALHPKP